jgi:peptide/nickel transport system ATP-binding protein
VGKATVYAVDDVSLAIHDGEVVCLVGESGCGKTTTGKMAVGLLRPTGGEVRYRGKDIWHMSPDEFRQYRQAVQIIHQDPYSSLNPTQSIADIISAPLLRHGAARNRKEARRLAADLLRTVDLTPPEDLLDKYPHQLSGGQRQRVSVARALTVHPTFIMADEAVSMLDVSIRVSLLKMLSRFRHELGMTYLFITHDLAVARYFAWDGRIAVMYLGRVVEIGPTPCLIHHPQHPYTKALLSAIPEADPVATRNRERVPLRSMDVPSLVNLPKGCAFHPRCPLFVPGLCDVEVPQLIEITVNDTPMTVGATREPMGAVGAIHESPLRDTCATLQIACHVVAAQQKRNGDAPRSREELERIYSGKGSAAQ